MFDDKYRVTEILQDPNKKTLSARGALSRLFRVILDDFNVTPMGWNRRMDNYLNDPANGIPRTGKPRHTARGNINKQMASDPMTIKTFLKMMRFLGATRIRFSVQLTIRKKVTEHSVELQFSEHHEPESRED